MHRLYILLLLVVTFFSCERQDAEAMIDLINVVRDDATIPAYIYGNTGSKVFLIILHGGPGGSGLEYRGGAFTESMEQDYAVVYTDQRGQGMSQGNLNPEDFTPENLAADVHALALSLRYKYGEDIRLFLFGHSWGGTLGSTVMVNPEYAVQYRGWIEVAGAHDMPMTFLGGLTKMDTIAGEQIAAGNNVSYWEGIRESVSQIEPTIESNDQGILTQNMLAFKAEQKLTDQGDINAPSVEYLFDALNNIYFINNNITSFFSGNYTNGIFFENGLTNFSVTDQLKNIETPSLLLWGKYDMVVSDTLGYSALEEIGAEDKALHIFEESGHSPFVNEPALFTEIVIDFIERLK